MSSGVSDNFLSDAPVEQRPITHHLELDPIQPLWTTCSRAFAQSLGGPTASRRWRSPCIGAAHNGPVSTRKAVKNIFQIYKPFFIPILFATLLTGCDRKLTGTPQAMAGVYVFQFDNGNYEVFTLSEDHQYRQEYYQTVESYVTNGIPMYLNTAAWEYHGNSIRLKNHLLFYKAIAVMHFGGGYPGREEYRDVFWERPAGNARAAFVVVAGSPAYWLVRMGPVPVKQR